MSWWGWHTEGTCCIILPRHRSISSSCPSDSALAPSLGLTSISSGNQSLLGVFQNICAGASGSIVLRPDFLTSSWSSPLHSWRKKIFLISNISRPDAWLWHQTKSFWKPGKCSFSFSHPCPSYKGWIFSISPDPDASIPQRLSLEASYKPPYENYLPWFNFLPIQIYTTS